MAEEKRPWEQVFEPPPPPRLTDPAPRPADVTPSGSEPVTTRRLAAVPTPTPTLTDRIVTWWANHQVVVNPEEVTIDGPGARVDLQCRGAEEVTRVIGAAGLMGEEFHAAVEVRTDENNPLLVRIELGEPGSLGTEGPARQIVAYLPVDVRTAVDRTLAATGDSFTEFFLQAFNRQYDKLGKIFPSRARDTGPMPLRTKQRRRRATGGNLVQAWIYLTDEQRAVLDEAEQQVGAGNRSVFITKILEYDLAQSATLLR